MFEAECEYTPKYLQKVSTILIPSANTNYN